MTTINRARFARALPPALILAAALVLTACGGGGDVTQQTVQSLGGNTDTTGTAATGPVTVQNFAIAPIALTAPQATADAKKFALAATQTSTGPASPYGAASPADAIEQLLNFGEASYAMYFPKHTDTLTFQQYRYRYYPDTGVYLGVADGTGGTTDGGVYVMGGPFGTTPTYVGQLTSYITPYAVLHYQDVILANTDLYGWYPMKLVLTSGATTGTVTFTAEKAVNMTKFQTGEWPLFNCGFNRVKLATGAIKLSCQDRVSGARQNLVWSPVTNQITEYDDSEGAYPVLSDTTWVFAPTDVPPVAGWSRFAEIGAGWVWNSTTDWGTQHFKRKSDGTDTILPLSIGLVKAFGVFSN